MNQKILFALIACYLFFSQNIFSESYPENERPVITISDNDFQILVLQREQGLAGFQHNVDSTPFIPAKENAVSNWAALSATEKNRYVSKQEEMFRQGNITMIVMAGGEATRFGQPKPFITVSEQLGEFLEIKAANLNWIQKTYGKQVPLYILASEKRLQEFKIALSERKYYGFDPNIFRWFVQGTVDTFIPSDDELKTVFNSHELNAHLKYALAIRQENPDGIYRFKGECRKVPPGHFDTLAAFVVSGLFSEALSSGIDFALVVNIDNLQAILKNDGMIAYFAEKEDDLGFLLTEKNVYFTITDKAKKKIIQNKLSIRFRDNILSFDGMQEFTHEGEQEGYKYVINQAEKTVDVFDVSNGQSIETEITIKSEIGGTLVQNTNEKGEPIGEPLIKEGFELSQNFDHANAPFFNTNTVIIKLRSLLKFLDISQEQLTKMNFDQRSSLVNEKLIKQVKANFEMKNHEVTGEYPNLGIIKNGKTKILVVQVTRIMLQVAHLKQAKASYIFAPRTSIFAPVKEQEDKSKTAENNQESLQKFIRYAIPKN